MPYYCLLYPYNLAICSCQYLGFQRPPSRRPVPGRGLIRAVMRMAYPANRPLVERKVPLAYLPGMTPLRLANLQVGRQRYNAVLGDAHPHSTRRRPARDATSARTPPPSAPEIQALPARGEGPAGRGTRARAPAPARVCAGTALGALMGDERTVPAPLPTVAHGHARRPVPFVPHLPVTPRGGPAPTPLPGHCPFSHGRRLACLLSVTGRHP